MFCRTAIRVGVSAHMYGKPTWFCSQAFSKTHESIQNHHYIVHWQPVPPSFEYPRLSVWDHMRRRQAFLFYSSITLLWPIDFNQARLPVTVLSKEKALLLLFFPKAYSSQRRPPISISTLSGTNI